MLTMSLSGTVCHP